MAHATLPIDAVQVVDTLYPRLKPHEDKIEEYRDSVDSAPPITVARGCVLVDGYHRWQAHKRNGAETIKVLDLGELSDEEILAEAVRLNARHGTSLTVQEKRLLAPVLIERARLTQAKAAKVLAVSERSVRDWVKAQRSDEEKARKAAGEAKRQADIAEAVRLRAEGWTLRAIGDHLGVHNTTVGEWLQGTGNSSASLQAADEEGDDRAEGDDHQGDQAEEEDDSEPEPEPEVLDDETAAFLAAWSEDGDLLAAVEAGSMTIRQAVGLAYGRRSAHDWAHAEAERKRKRGEDAANQELYDAVQLLLRLLDMPNGFTATDDENWRSLQTIAPEALERINEWKEAADDHLA